jgi:hypothetical protein
MRPGREANEMPRRKGLVAWVSVVAALTATIGAFAAGHEPYPCDPTKSPGPYSQEPPPPATTTFVMDGDLYAVVRSTRGGLIAGWSGPPVLTFDGAFRWLRALGVPQAEMFSGREPVGATFGDGGSRSDFFFECNAGYTARAVVRRGRYPVQFGVVDELGAKVTRAFHTPPLRLPLNALVELRFSHPLARQAPTLRVDRNADHRWERRIVLEGGAGGLRS